MATIRQLKRRITSVKNTAKITNALQLVAASKMRRAQDRALQARPYAEKLRVVLAGLASTEGGDENVPGQYGIEVILSRPVCIFSLTQVEKSEIAKSVLDCFHQHQGIECLDDFEITATLPNGQVISEDDESAATGLVKSTDHLGKLSVRIHDFDLPADLDPRFREQTRQLREITDILNMQVDPHSECNNCGAMIDSILGCPGGAEICQDCFDSGSH